jgi:hypothetical protein
LEIVGDGLGIAGVRSWGARRWEAIVTNIAPTLLGPVAARHSSQGTPLQTLLASGVPFPKSRPFVSCVSFVPNRVCVVKG